LQICKQYSTTATSTTTTATTTTTAAAAAAAALIVLNQPAYPGLHQVMPGPKSEALEIFTAAFLQTVSFLLSKQEHISA